jgi:phage regulator Rha-like protein
VAVSSISIREMLMEKSHTNAVSDTIENVKRTLHPLKTLYAVLSLDERSQQARHDVKIAFFVDLGQRGFRQARAFKTPA